jgi:hydrogenase expression/formation protein HypE
VTEAGRRQARRIDLQSGKVEMNHGAGGRAMTDLVDLLFKPALDNPLLAQGNDQALFELPPGRVAMSTDSFVITPLFFPGGDIGSLAIHGTVNDLAMGGAKPIYLSAGFILEEGLPLADLHRIVQSMAEAARDAGVQIVTGDTKVVERGSGDGVFINTCGVGVVPPAVDLGVHRVEAGDAVLVSGTLGDHGVAIMSQREGLSFQTSLTSDSASLHGLVAAMVAAAPGALHLMRDPTRGGVAATLNEIAQQTGQGILIEEERLPVSEEVRGACELLGLDPLTVANEGKLLAIVAQDEAEEVLAAMRAHPRGERAARVGTVTEDDLKLVRMRTPIGGERVVDWLYGEQLPRIC